MRKPRTVITPRCSGKSLRDVEDGKGIARGTKVIFCDSDGTEQCVNYAGVTIALCPKCKARYRKLGLVA